MTVINSLVKESLKNQTLDYEIASKFKFSQ